MDEAALNEERQTPLSNEQLYLLIEQNPWDDKSYRDLLEAGSDRKRKNDSLLDAISWSGYRQLAEAMRGAQTLEEKYRLLAEKAPIHRQYQDSYRSSLVWYDIIQGFSYSNYADKRDNDPFGDYPESVYQTLEGVLIQKGRHWKIGADLGSGVGDTSRLMSPELEKVIAIDRFPFLHDVAKQRAQEKGLGNIDYIDGDLADSIPLPSQSTDVVVCNGLTAFIPADRLDNFAMEVARVLKPGGSYFEPLVGGATAEANKQCHAHSPKSLMAFMIGELMTSSGHNLSGAYPHSSKEFEGAFAKAGFRFRQFISTRGGFSNGVIVLECILPGGDLTDEAEMGKKRLFLQS